MKLPKIMDAAVRKLASIPADVPSDVIDISWDDQVWGSEYGCETCGYGAPEDTLTVQVTWSDSRGRTKYWSKEYQGYGRLPAFFGDLEA